MSNTEDHNAETQKGFLLNTSCNQRDREEKIKIARERQNEERQRKIDELKAQAEAAQRYREQKEEERRRRIDDMRSRDIEKRHLVEERKKAILEAEKERREYILRKNVERETRLETKKRERNVTAFAFGSSTPRLLDTDIGMVSPSTFWAHRRSTSISNVAMSRRSSERELTDIGSKKRATSASGAGRNEDEGLDTSQIIFRSVARRKTDLMPTLPSPRDGLYGSRYSLSSTPRSAGSRSGNITPGGYLSSRPGSALSTSTNNAAVVITRRSTTVRKPRPASIAGTGMSTDDLHKLKVDSNSMRSTPKRPPTLMSTSMTITSSFSRPPTNFERRTPKKENTTISSRSNKLFSSTEKIKNSKTENNKLTKTKEVLKQSSNNITNVNEGINKSTVQNVKMSSELPPLTPARDEICKIDLSNHDEFINNDSIPNNNDIMSASMMAKIKITTEEEAKAALAERRKAAREEAERQADLERQKLEAEQLQIRKQEEEELERQRQFEMEAIRLAEEQRYAEEKRLQQAIEEAKQREEEERRRREDEEKHRMEKEEIERRAKEETEKQKLEVAERLKREEKEREERRKRVEAIMSRTRKGGTSGPSIKDETNDEKKLTIEQNDGCASNTDTTNMEKLLTNDDEPINSQAMYEQLVSEKDLVIINNITNKIIDDNDKNVFQKSQEKSVTNGNNVKPNTSESAAVLSATQPSSISIINNNLTTLVSTNETLDI